jgi:hypothetical protein
MIERIEVGLPEGLDVVRHGSHIEIVRKWFEWKVVAITGFALLWDGFLINWYMNVAPRADPMATYFPLIHVAVGIGITYYVIAGWLNRTHILVGRGKVIVHHRPIPWFGNSEIDASTLKQLYAQERVIQRRRGRSTSTFEVRAVTHDGRNRSLVGSLASEEQALSIEREIEKHLGIRDIPVAGQIG